MKRWYVLMTIAVMLAALLFTSACVSKGAYDELQRELQKTKEEVVQLNSLLSNTREELTSTREELSSTKAKYDELQRELQKTKEEVVQLNSLLSNTREELTSTREELSSTRAKLEATEEELNLYKETGISVYSGVQPNYSLTKIIYLTSPSLVKLVNNPGAVNPTWASLVKFLLEDETDEQMVGLMESVCAISAETVHNNAEKAGIKAAWVAVDFEEGIGHALNAFVTTDRGLVFVDCTGKEFGIVPILPYKFEEGKLIQSYRPPVERDNIAYLEKGRELGFVSLDVATSAKYELYEEHTQKRQDFEDMLEDYNEDVERYNQEVTGKVYYIGSPELARIESWKADLDKQEQILKSLRESLGTFWEPMGVVSKIEIYW
ncbi:MAG: Chromosome partition protein Smc [Syntrophomonadaceae bacterium]|nr:Chromosome partition protein Smc [Bacillota bacterium]MBT9148238.1 Chromosome partition protein Smc [Bacillota bacterium]